MAKNEKKVIGLCQTVNGLIYFKRDLCRLKILGPDTTKKF